jgi:hypothetical protein
MCYSIAYSLGCEPSQIHELTTDLVEVLVSSNRFREAGDLYITLPDYQISQAVEYYSKGSAFMQAIKESMKNEDETARDKCLQTTKSSLSLTYDVKKNQFLKSLEDFDKRYLRLKIVQS